MNTSNLRFARYIFTILLIGGLLPVASSAQIASDSSRTNRLMALLKQDVFRVGLFAQMQGLLPLKEDTFAGFSVTSARVGIRGDLDRGFSYLLQTELVRSDVLLDMRIGYRLNERLQLFAGYFKTPFSGNFMVGLPRIDLIQRPRLVRALAPRRQAGLALAGSSQNGGLRYWAGVFNGNGSGPEGNDDNSLQYMGRLAFYPEPGLEVGINGSIEQNGGSANREDRVVTGGDFRYAVDRFFVSAEVLVARFDLTNGVRVDPVAYHVTAGFMLEPARHQVLGRLDHLNNDVPGVEKSTLMIIGYAFYPDQLFKMQINYYIPTRDTGLRDTYFRAAFQFHF